MRTPIPVHPAPAAGGPGASTALGGRTLAELVVERADRALVFESLGLDYCCHGDRPLADAAAAAGLDPAAVAAAVQDADADARRSADGTDAAELAPDALADHIVATHHRYLRDQLPVLQGLAHKVRDVHGSRHGELVEVADLVDELTADLLPHLDVEEEDLFPTVRALVAGDPTADASGLGTIEQLRVEHVAAGDLLARLRSTTDGHRVPDDGCASYRLLYQGLADLESDTFRHIHLENNVLFPAVLPA